VGAVSLPWLEVMRCAPVPSAFAIQISMFPDLLLAYAMRLPSGEKVGAKAWPSFFVMLSLRPS
jgi:hypothetical protein